VKIDLYLLNKYFKYTQFVITPILNVLQAWTESLGHTIRVKVCDESGVHMQTDADIVAFSVYTFMAPAAYRLSDQLRQKGKFVILGGPHFHGHKTIEEAKPHCDVVVETICMEQWANLLRDIEYEKILPGSPQAKHVADTDNKFRFPDNMHEIYKTLERFRFPLVMSSLGCPYHCDFCNAYMPGKYILRDIQTIYKELSAMRGKVVVFCDATFGLNKQYAIDLMNAIAPLGKHLFVQTTLGILDDKLIDAFKSGGVGWVSVGIESFAVPQKKHGRNACDKNRDALNRIIDVVNKRGISVQANFICGMDSDTIDSFDRIYDFYRTSNCNEIIVDILSPLPNTKIFDYFEREGRIFDYNWEHYDYHNVVYRPKNMTVDQLIDGYVQLNKAISSTSMVLRKNLQVLKTTGIAVGWPMMSWKVLHCIHAREKNKFLKNCQDRIHDAHAGILPEGVLTAAE
jgi:radical SAM superfamily enzyme YgiQ (UPF0313 family)